MAGHRKLHAIMIAFTFQGHITPFINLALKLASNGCTITFVHTEFIHQMLSHTHQDVDFFFEARESGLDVRYRTIYDGFPIDYDRNLNFNEYWESILRDFPSRVDELVGEIIQSDHDQSFMPFLVADTFYSWPATVAKKYNILNVSFWTEPALVFAIDYHLDLLRENGHLPRKVNHEGLIDYIPGVQPISSKDLMSYLQDPDITTMVHQIVFKAFNEVKYADFILMNTVDELEHDTILALNQSKLTYAIGPINFSSDFTKTVVHKSLWPQSNCDKWLNTKTPGSVLYVSFGSIFQSSKELTEEIAHGLLLSEVNFIWVVREGHEDILPVGFQNEMGDRGLVVTWCNQNVVISNPAVGGFLTHCGWNSVLESIWCGVPMVCSPFLADQPTNRKLVVDDWKIGINLCDGTLATREEVAENIKRLMRGETSDSLRSEVKKMRTILHNALAEGGSTGRNFDQFFKDLITKVYASGMV